MGPDTVLQSLLYPGYLIQQVIQQRRAPVSPYFTVGLRRPAGARVQDYAVEDQPPDQPGYLNDPRVAQELLEVRAQGFGRGRLGGAQVGEQHPG